MVEKWSSGGLGSFSSSDEDVPKDGRIDGIAITVRVPVEYPGIIREEFASAMGGLEPVYNTALSGGKTIFFEHETIDQITSADIKSFRLIQNLTDNIGGLYPYMPIDDILNIQQ